MSVIDTINKIVFEFRQSNPDIESECTDIATYFRRILGGGIVVSFILPSENTGVDKLDDFETEIDGQASSKILGREGFFGYHTVLMVDIDNTLCIIDPFCSVAVQPLIEYVNNLRGINNRLDAFVLVEAEWDYYDRINWKEKAKKKKLVWRYV